MSLAIRKFVAVLMLLWLPIAGGSALAASLSMQAQNSDCHEMTGMDMHHPDMAGHHHAQPAHDEGNSHNSCAACHLACGAYLDAPVVAMALPHMSAQKYAPLLIAFNSVTTSPLLPPPLAQA